MLKIMNYILTFAVVLGGVVVCAQDLPSVYEYFADTPNLTGLTAGNNEFRLNGKYIRIISGAVHYFRIHPDLWRDRLRKLRATGANTVETYVPWNLHEPQRGIFDFGDGGNDMSTFLNVRRYIQIAQEEDLLVLFRPGPYICSEWDFGGLPSWLQRDPEMRVRESYQPYLDRVKVYMDYLLPQVTDLQFTRGGPIIAAQIENEYESLQHKDPEYLEFIRQSFLDNGIDCLLFTSDSHGFLGDGMDGTLPGILQTANFQTNPDRILDRLLEIQPDMPVMAMEYWSGWYNHWFDPSKAGSSPTEFRDVLEIIFSKYNGSVNFYMFHGGTNFGFMAGGNNVAEPPYLLSDITSYDYDAPLSEAGDFTEKYNYAVELISQYENPKLRKPERPAESIKIAYTSEDPQSYLSYENIIDQIPLQNKVYLQKPVSMENLPINNGNGQSYGYIIYRKISSFTSGDRYKASWPRDFAQLLVDGNLVDTGFYNEPPEYWINSIKEFPLNAPTGVHVVDLLVENIARNNFGVTNDFVQQKGIAPIHQSKIEINDQEIEGVEIIAAEFKSAWVAQLQNWTSISNPAIPVKAPCMIKFDFIIAGIPSDTFLNMSEWHKGIVFVNGFNIGRYFRAGPQQNLYIPAPFLRTGGNTIIIFEQLEASNKIVFSRVPNLG